MNQISELQALLLANRGIKEGDIPVFLNPSYETGVYDPYLMKDMEKSVNRILKAIEENERIGIFSDYDADGVPGAVMMKDFFDRIEYENVFYYIPDRHLEGFGLKDDSVTICADNGVKLLITVDCGITDASEVKHANKLGMEVIITDHHLPSVIPAEAGIHKYFSAEKSSGHDSARQLPSLQSGPIPTSQSENSENLNLDPRIREDDRINTRMTDGEGKSAKEQNIQNLPPAFAILDPKQEGDEYPDKMLCGTGVAFKLIQGILAKNRFGMGADQEKWLLDMVGIATLSDMVPLLDENRVLASYGLKVLRKSRRPGLVALLKRAGVDQRLIAEEDIGFMIAPRINAAGRMGHAMDAFKMLSSTDVKEAELLADHINGLNDERKGIVARMVKEMKSMLLKRIEHEKERGVIVLGHPDWKPSLLGLAANSIVEEHGMPVFLWGRESGTVIKGSCRSNGVVNVVEIMRTAEEGSFIDFGGHAMSGGFSVSDEKIHFLSDSLAKAYKEVLLTSDGELKQNYSIDTALGLNEVNEKTYKDIQMLSPYGEANPKPVFLFKSVIVKTCAQFGKEKNHLKITVAKDGGRAVEAIAFFVDENSYAKEVKEGASINLVANIEKSFFRGRGELRLRIVDII
jgi:single-stranded-DNA-specific exonuclease